MKFWLFLWLWQGAPQPAEIAKRAMAEGRFAEAAKIYAQLAAANPGEALIRFNLGVAQYSAKQFGPAAQSLRVFLRSQPAHPQANLLLASALVKTQKSCEALPLLAKAQGALGGRAEFLSVSGEAKLGCLDYSGAAADYASLTRQAPANPKGWYGLGKAKLELQDQEGARAAFAQLSALPFSEELRQLELEVARGLARNGRIAEAKEAYARLLALNPGDAGAEYEWGALLEKAEGPEAALPHYENAVRSDSSFLIAHGALGRALLQLGRGTEAIAPLEKATKAGIDKSLWAALANAYRAAGRTEDARRALLRAR